MYKEHVYINTPPRELVIWRYLDLWKFLDIIDNKKLYLSRADSFEDKFEGTIPLRKVYNLEDDHPIKKITEFSKTLKKSTYLSCWSCEQIETYSLWKVYSDYRTALAIKSTVGDLIDSISENDGNQYIGSIKYISQNSDYRFNGNTYQLFYEKRDYFNFEKEIRLLYSLPYKDNRELLELPFSTKIEINPEKLINEIYLAPLADDNFKHLIELKLKDLELDIKVKHSDI